MKNKGSDSLRNQQNALESAINNFLSDCFGLPAEKFQQPGLFCSSAGTYFERDPNSIRILERDETIVVLAGSEQLKALQGGLSSASQLFQLLSKFQKTYDDTDRFISAEAFVAFELPEPYFIRPLVEGDQRSLEAFYKQCSKEESENVDIDLASDKAWGAFEKDELVATSRFYLIPKTQMADLGVIVRPDYRSKGLAKGVVTETVRQALKSGKYPRYRTNKDNLSTVAVANALGFEANYSLKTYEVV